MNSLELSFLNLRKEVSRMSLDLIDSKRESIDNLLKIKNVIEYCEPHLEQMWAARVVGILLGCDFRDCKEHLDDFYDKCEELGL